MKWEDYKKGETIDPCTIYTKTDIECPKCGALLYQDTSIVYMSNPQKHDFYCFKCKWNGRK